jgi:methionine-rich copper-binding protein CopC
MKYLLPVQLAIAASLVAAGAAQAHPRLLSTTPTANTTTSKPRRVVLNFSESLIPAMTGADIFMTGHPGKPHHPPMKTGGITSRVAPNGKTLVLTASRPLPSGSYQVNWHAVATDTHRVQGTFKLAVK